MSNRETITIESAGPADTAIIGQAVGTALPPGTLLTLQGTLGAGKTNLVQAIADALGIDRKNVVSPTFTMIQIHHGQLKNEPRELVHIDAYRINDEDQYLELGIDEYIESDAIVAIEWGEKFQELLPNERLEIVIRVLDESTRQFQFSWLADAHFAESLTKKLADTQAGLQAE